MYRLFIMDGTGVRTIEPVNLRSMLETMRQCQSRGVTCVTEYGLDIAVQPDYSHPVD